MYKSLFHDINQWPENIITTLLSIGDAVISTDKNGLVLIMNPMAEELTGWSFKDAKKRPIEEIFRIIDEKTGTPLETPVSRVLEGLKAELKKDTILISKDGKKIPIADSSSPIFNCNRDITGVVLIFRDITIQKNAEKALLNSEEKFSKAFKTNPEATIITKIADGTFLEVNECFLELMKYENKEITEKNIVELNMWIDLKQRDLFLEKVKENGEIKDFETMLKNKNGNIINCLISSKILKIQNELYILSIIKNITGRKDLEEKLLHSQKMEAIGQIAGGVSHDFNNILTGIMGYANLIKMESKSDSIVYDAALTIEKAGERATELVKQLMGFSRKSKSINISLNVHDIITEITSLLKRTLDKNINIYDRLEAINPVITGDPAQIQQVILNLAVNARDAMPVGGDLIETEQVKPDNNDTSCEYIVISIKDNGYGIDKKTQEHIFEPFFTTKEKEKGTGMGLAITYNIVKNHGGFIKVISEVNKGSNFKIYLPLNSTVETAKERECKSKPEKIHYGKGKILILDDEKVILDITSRVLRSLGYEVITACNAIEGLEYFRKASNEIDIVIIDIVMPEINGLECFYEFKKINPKTKIILSSGYGIDENTQELIRQNLCKFIQKPYNISELSKIIESIR